MLLVLGSADVRAQVPSFSGIGDLAGGATTSAAADVSSDGAVVVGTSESASGTEAFRWTEGGGIVGLGFLSGSSPYSTAVAVSDDGAVVAGSSHESGGGRRAYRWSASVMTQLGTQSCSDCDPVTDAYGLSGNGLVAVGASVARGTLGSPLHLDPVSWPGGGTSIVNLGNLSGGAQEAGEALDATTTGSVIVGSHSSGNGNDAWYATGSGPNALPTLIGGSIIAAAATAVSADGTTIVGYSNKGTVVLPGGTEVPNDLQAVRWTGGSYATLTELGSLPGAVSIDSRALAVTHDGAVIVGQAADATISDRAFVWDASNGMRDLKSVLVDEYGLDLTGWVLTEATGIADHGAGELTIVGSGINPAGDPEGWIAFLSTPGCSDLVDNDLDLDTDHPADAGCRSPVDWTEEDDCDDGVDNDVDGDTDFPADPGCLSAADPTEQPDCSDGLDNDSDGDIDFPADLGCASGLSVREDPACQDGADNDLDLATDHPADPECLAPSDRSETPDCGDGIDNDDDGDIDFPADAECESAADLSEATQCSDGIDNDLDGRIDLLQYPGCTDPSDPIEAPQCDDGVDNDLDGDTDFPDDAGCASALGANEAPFLLAEGDLIAVDRTSRTVFRIDTTTGVQTLLSENSRMGAPQGIDHRAGEVVVADPAGLVAIDGSGEQRLASPPLLANDSLQVVVDDLGDAFVLEADQVSRVAWNESGLGVKSTYLAVPTPGPIPVLGIFHGDSLAMEPSGDLVTSGLSLFGDGVFRIDSVPSAAIVKPGFDDLLWLDLAVENDGTILAVGFFYSTGPGIFRVDPITGDTTVLNDSYAWNLPNAVAVDASGEIYVADAGLCADGLCSGGEIVHVDPSTGDVTPLSSGDHIAGEVDIAFVPEPGQLPMLVAGAAALGLLQARRRRRGGA